MLKKLFFFLILIVSYTVKAQNNKDLFVKAFTSKDSSEYYLKKLKKQLRMMLMKRSIIFVKMLFIPTSGHLTALFIMGKRL